MPSKPKICFATNNAHKREEVVAALNGAFEILTLKEIHCQEELPETTGSIAGNARQKADYVWDHYHVPCFADDSGLEVEFLHGEPGVDSAHYAGPQRSSEDNMKLLLDKLKQSDNRRAQFRTVIALRMPEGKWEFEGVVKGVILRERRGQGGFGYDPLFLPDGKDRTLAEMTLEEKNKISHRSVAVRKLREFLTTYSGGKISQT